MRFLSNYFDLLFEHEAVKWASAGLDMHSHFDTMPAFGSLCCAQHRAVKMKPRLRAMWKV